ncbi:cystine/glutamate transporter-like [Anneissia japonica]|uniref:cystine/glutamate transporter-like n=1 Tax=Anneissia japonica TaxID=1529436 RepID=UPI001425AF67|nr:cystine/glutamate transporter-like [Anneissia japonica]
MEGVLRLEEAEEEQTIENKNVLARQLGLFASIAITVGTVVGSGIFISPKGIVLQIDSVGLSLVIWVACGIVSVFGALSYCELATSCPKSGGDFTYLLNTYGPLVAFLNVWTSLLATRTASTAVLAITAATYILRPFSSGCEELPALAVRLLAAALLFIIFYLNCVSVRWTSGAQKFFTSIKVLCLCVGIAVGIVLLCKGKYDNLKEPFRSVDVNVGGLSLAFYSGLYAYSGWQNLPQLTEEIVRPRRNIPLSITVSMVTIIIIYFCVNVAYFIVLTPSEIRASEAVALDFTAKINGNVSWIISICVAISCIGSINGSTLGTSRRYFVASREGYLPSLFSMIQIRNKTPAPVGILMLLISTLTLCADNIYSIIYYLSFSRWLFLGLVVSTVPYLRIRCPEMERPYKVPLFMPIIFTLFSVFVVSVALYTSPKNCGAGALIMLSGVPVYLIGVKSRSKPPLLTRAAENCTRFFQMLLLVVESDEPDKHI